jgi:hypothetical protein
LDRLGAEPGRLYLHMRRRESPLLANLFQILRLGLFAFADDEQSLEGLAQGGTPPQIASLLAMFRLIVLSHAMAVGWVRTQTAVDGLDF